MNILFSLILMAFSVLLLVVNRVPEPKRVKVSDRELLNRRYESGEISVQEYFYLLKHLQ